MSYAKPKDFIWKPAHPNNMPQNGIDGYYCIIRTSSTCARKYTILFQYRIDERGFIHRDKIEYYILFEEILNDIKPNQKIVELPPRYLCTNKQSEDEYYIMGTSIGLFHRVYTTLEEAKQGALNFYFAIYGETKVLMGEYSEELVQMYKDYGKLK